MKNESFGAVLEAERLAATIHAWPKQLESMRGTEVKGGEWLISFPYVRGLDLISTMENVSASHRGYHRINTKHSAFLVATILARRTFDKDPIIIKIREILGCNSNLPDWNRLISALSVPYNEAAIWSSFTDFENDARSKRGANVRTPVSRAYDIFQDRHRPARERLLIQTAADGGHTWYLETNTNSERSS